LAGNRYNAIKQGRAHISSAIDTHERLLTASDIKVMPIRVKRPAIVEGIVRRFVWKVENPRFLN